MSLAPFLGDGSDLAIQAYYKFATDKGADPVVVTLAAIGLGVDAFTGAAGEVATAVKTVYKLGGTVSKEMIRALVESIGQKSARAGFDILKDSAGFMLKATIRGNLKVLEDALKLAKEGGGSALDGLKRFSASYKKFDGLFPGMANSANDLLIKVSKYGIYAAQTAKAAGQCGSTCISDVGKFIEILVNRARLTRVSGLNRIHDLEYVIKSGKTVKSNVNQIVFSTAISFCKLFSRVDPLSIQAQAFTFPNCLLGKQELADLARGYANSVMHNASSRIAAIIQLPDGRKFHGISGDVHDALEIDPDIKKLYDSIFECQEVKSKTNGKCAEAKALTRALTVLKAEGKGINELKGSLSVAVNVRLPGHGLYSKIKDACEDNCQPALKRLGIDWIRPGDVE